MQDKMEKRKQKKKKQSSKAPLIAVFVVCLGLLAFSIFQLTGIYLEYKKGTTEYEELQKYVKEELPEDGSAATLPGTDVPSMEDGEELPQEERLQRVSFDELKSINSDIAAWIEIPGSGISYPVMKTDDDAYYLNHTFSKKVNSAGSIFMEALNAADFTDLHTIIYGHNMKNGSMFAGLKNYTSPSYLLSHPTVYVDLPDGTHAYQIFSCYEAEADSDSYTIGFAPDEQYAQFVQGLKDRSQYDTGVGVTVDDAVITLSTCTKSGEKRFLVHAKKIS